MDKKEKLGTLLSKTGKAAKNLFESAAQAIDQNDDGKLDFKDVGIVANAVGDAVKKGSQSLKEFSDEKKREFDLGRLLPIFPEELSDAEFTMPKFIRVTERDKAHAESELCQGSIGHLINPKGLRMVNVYQDSIDAFGLKFFPDTDREFYYIDPIDRDRYIALDEYFGYLKSARITELQKIAQSLGAKHFRVTYKEEQTTFSKKTSHIQGGAKKIADVDVSHNVSEKKFARVEIAAESDFEGRPPVEPELKYMRYYPDIQALVSMRLDKDSPLLHQKYIFKMSTSCGIKEDDAVKIDAALKELKCSGNTTVASEAMNESRRYLEYEIDF